MVIEVLGGLLLRQAQSGVIKGFSEGAEVVVVTHSQIANNTLTIANDTLNLQGSRGGRLNC